MTNGMRTESVPNMMMQHRRRRIEAALAYGKDDLTAMLLPLSLSLARLQARKDARNFGDEGSSLLRGWPSILLSCRDEARSLAARIVTVVSQTDKLAPDHQRALRQLAARMRVGEFEAVIACLSDPRWSSSAYRSDKP